MTKRDKIEIKSISRRDFLKRVSLGGAILLVRPMSTFGKSLSMQSYDVVIYGGSSAGVIAAVQAKRMGKTAVIVNPYSFLGGMTSSGLNSADTGNRASVSGMALEFFSGMGQYYSDESMPTPEIPHSILTSGQYISMGPRTKGFSRVFEPHVAEKAFSDLIANADVPVFHNERLDLKNSVIMEGDRIQSIHTENGRSFSGKMFIDATYEGDLMAGADVTYTVGREGNEQYGETLNGFQLVGSGDLKRISDIGESDHFIKDVDPYIVPGDPTTGLLPWVNNTLRNNGEADHRVQAFNYRVILTDDPANQIPFQKPEGYRELDHELLLRNFEAGDVRLPGRLAEIPNRKIDWNTYGAVGTDMAGSNVNYAEADHETRKKIDQAHELYTRGHFWILAHHPRVPAFIRNEMKRWGFARDEFQRNGGLPYMLYVREARRMVSDTVMTEHHCRHQKKVPDPVALASFAMDSHVVQYVVNERGFAKREGVVLKACNGPYGVSYQSIVPRQGECPNLFVPVCLSATHVAHGSIRMEPVFMSLGQASATAASIAIDKNMAVQQVPYTGLRERLLVDKMILEWKHEE